MTDLTAEYEDAYELSDMFDTYCYEHGVSMTQYWTWLAEHWSTDEFGDVIADEGITTLQGCIDFFCK